MLQGEPRCGARTWSSPSRFQQLQPSQQSCWVGAIISHFVDEKTVTALPLRVCQSVCVPPAPEGLSTGPGRREARRPTHSTITGSLYRLVLMVQWCVARCPGISGLSPLPASSGIPPAVTPKTPQNCGMSSGGPRTAA